MQTDNVCACALQQFVFGDVSRAHRRQTAHKTQPEQTVNVVFCLSVHICAATNAKTFPLYLILRFFGLFFAVHIHFALTLAPPPAAATATSVVIILFLIIYDRNDENVSNWKKAWSHRAKKKVSLYSMPIHNG